MKCKNDFTIELECIIEYRNEFHNSMLQNAEFVPARGLVAKLSPEVPVYMPTLAVNGKTMIGKENKKENYFASSDPHHDI